MDSLYSLRYADEAGVLLGVPSGRPTIALPPDLGPYLHQVLRPVCVEEGVDGLGRELDRGQPISAGVGSTP
jgi:hypothetical protein